MEYIWKLYCVQSVTWLPVISPEVNIFILHVDDGSSDFSNVQLVYLLSIYSLATFICSLNPAIFTTFSFLKLFAEPGTSWLMSTDYHPNCYFYPTNITLYTFITFADTYNLGFLSKPSTSPLDFIPPRTWTSLECWWWTYYHQYCVAFEKELLVCFNISDDWLPISLKFFSSI